MTHPELDKLAKQYDTTYAHVLYLRDELVDLNGDNFVYLDPSAQEQRHTKQALDALKFFLQTRTTPSNWQVEIQPSFIGDSVIDHKKPRSIVANVFALVMLVLLGIIVVTSMVYVIVWLFSKIGGLLFA